MNTNISDEKFRNLIRRLLENNQSPTLTSGWYEVEIYYNHRALPKRMIKRLAIYSAKGEASKRLDELHNIRMQVEEELDKLKESK
jgi:hypothetical protein